MSREELKYRDQAIDTLTMLSSKEEQINYKKNVPIINIPGEFICWWFNDFFFDIETSPKYSKERNKSIINFKSCFSTQEWTALNEFHSFFEQQVDKLPEECDINVLVENSIWKEIMLEARKTLEIFLKNT